MGVNFTGKNLSSRNPLDPEIAFLSRDRIFEKNLDDAGRVRGVPAELKSHKITVFWIFNNFLDFY